MVFLFQTEQNPAKVARRDPLAEQIAEQGIKKGDFFVLYSNTYSGQKNVSICLAYDSSRAEGGGVALNYFNISKWEPAPTNSHSERVHTKTSIDDMLTSKGMDEKLNGAYLMKLTLGRRVNIFYEPSPYSSKRKTEKGIILEKSEEHRQYTEPPYAEMTFKKKGGESFSLKISGTDHPLISIEPIIVQAPKKESSF
jgi:hypothetical protein